MEKEGIFILGMAGASCSGKSFIARKLDEALGDISLGVISLDSYYHDLSGLSAGKREKVNFDRPDAIDFEMLIGDLELLARGKKIRIPVYDFSTHTRRDENLWKEIALPAVSCRKFVLIIEGLHTLYNSNLRERIDLGVFVDTDPGVCLSRRIRRDVRERGRTERSVREVFERNVMPMYRKYVAPSRKFADITLDGAEDYPLNVSRAISAIKSLMGDVE